MYTKALLPSAIAATASAETLESVLAGRSDQLSSFTEYVTGANLLDTINGSGEATIFAPTNETSQAALEAYPDLVTSSDDDDNTVVISEDFMNILLYHVVPGAAHTTYYWLAYPGSFYSTARRWSCRQSVHDR